MEARQHGSGYGPILLVHGQEATWILRMSIRLRMMNCLDICDGTEPIPDDVAIGEPEFERTREILKIG